MFQRYSLAQAGLIVQLGHDGMACPNFRSRDGYMVVIHVDGLHFVKISYCGCERLGHSLPLVQLLRAGWMPATVERPRTVVTLECLRQFRAQYLQGKINAYDYYTSLEILTDCSGLHSPVVSTLVPTHQPYKQTDPASRIATGSLCGQADGTGT